MKNRLSIRRILGWLLMAAALIYLGRSIVELASSVDSYAVFPHWHALVASWMISLLWLIAMGLGWAWVLRFHTGCVSLPAFGTLAPVFMQSFVSRYVPGKVWPAIVLYERLRDRLASADVLRSYFLQQLHLLASAAVLAAGVLPWLLADLTSSRTLASIEPVILIAFVLGSAWALLPRQIFALANRLLPLPQEWRNQLVFRGAVRHWTVAFGISLLVGVFQGAAIIPLWQSIAGAEQQLTIAGMFGVVCAYAAARIVGQAAAIAPAGIGVREGAFVLLATSLSPEVALISVLWLRLLATTVELVAWLASSYWAYRGGRREPEG
ncbi:MULTISPECIES: hypothetical protein [unclassified Wenzhouxiangella]|uniref:hypothetical protein n=1 Tax=unclassified Wenzhouxiangella TaxID=2613841 RepID=UPI000E32A013|nr:MULTISPECIES: hypothetical protein [unclassified Wenzhouxiangella]RFF26760.1 hypothetical protein DZK25_11365 [Wenzhouxiangella sp. 15181]RFP67724.1 hypothetical protein DZK26_11410 [Wenzhouxiangella sp. 15190]